MIFAAFAFALIGLFQYLDPILGTNVYGYVAENMQQWLDQLVKFSDKLTVFGNTVGFETFWHSVEKFVNSFLPW